MEGMGLSIRALRWRRQRLCRTLRRESRSGKQVGLLASASGSEPVNRPIVPVTPFRRDDARAGHAVPAVPAAAPSRRYFMPTMVAADFQKTVRVVDPPQISNYIYSTHEFVNYVRGYPQLILPPFEISCVNIVPNGPSAELFPPISNQTIFGPMMGPGGSNVHFYDQNTDTD